MASTQQISPVLTLFRLSPGNYSIRITDLKDQQIATALAGQIPDLASLMVITPTDMKVFKFDGAQQRLEVPSAPETPAEVEQDPMEAAMAIVPSTEDTGEPAKPQVVKRERKKSTVGHDAACGRCNGVGQVSMLMEGGAAATGACPVCQGSGVVKRYGMR